MQLVVGENRDGIELVARGMDILLGRQLLGTPVAYSIPLHQGAALNGRPEFFLANQGYEVINRWNPQAVDPNRSFVDNSPFRRSGGADGLGCQAGRRVPHAHRPA